MSALKSDDYVKRIERFLDCHQIEDYRFVRRRKHRAVVVAHHGKVATIIFPTSGSDIRGPAQRCHHTAACVWSCRRGWCYLDEVTHF
jgi:hypothetical protein